MTTTLPAWLYGSGGDDFRGGDWFLGGVRGVRGFLALPRLEAPRDTTDKHKGAYRGHRADHGRYVDITSAA